MKHINFVYIYDFTGEQEVIIPTLNPITEAHGLDIKSTHYQQNSHAIISFDSHNLLLDHNTNFINQNRRHSELLPGILNDQEA